MSDKITSMITDFMNSVGDYLTMEYDPIYYKEFTKDQNLSNLFDFVGSYYMGGSTVPDTARYVVDLIKMNRNDRQ
jgi:hypothetical protein